MIARVVSNGMILIGVLSLALFSPVHAQPAPSSRRIAVVVGANAAPAGRRELRFALEDAQRMAEVLKRAGQFANDDVHVLLEPSAAELTQVLDRVAMEVSAAADTLLVFYYSGHSDGQALYPRGEVLPLANLRQQLLRIQARVCVGVLDTCRGGTWTQAKDLHFGPPLLETDLAALSSEGTVLVAASSGFENAHEAEVIRGSFFTHHLTAGLLGAADRSADGSVTVQEAYEYARERTVRDSARFAPLPQHPSFEIDLRGRQDVVLTQLSHSRSVLELVQTQGPLEVIQLASGISVAELPAGPRQARLSLARGQYLIRRVANGHIYSKEVEVPPAGVARLAEQQLAADSTELAMKGGDAQPVPRSQSTSPAAGWFQLSIAAGVSNSATGIAMMPGTDAVRREFAFSLQARYAISERLSWLLPFPAFWYRFGEEGHFEVIPRLGLEIPLYLGSAGPWLGLDVGVGVRWWTGLGQSVIAEFSGSQIAALNMGGQRSLISTPTTNLYGAVGYGWTIHNSVSLYPGVGFTHVPESRSWTVLCFGSTLMLGYRSLPLLEVHLTPEFALDVFASWAINPNNGDVYDFYAAGFTWDF